MKSTIRTTVTLKFDEGGQESEFSKTFGKSMEADDPKFAMDWMKGFVFLQCEKELLWPDYRELLPDAGDISPKSGTIEPYSLMPDEYAAWDNTRNVWLEILNVILETEHLMADFRAFRELEKTKTDEVEAWQQPQLHKIHCLNEAVLRLSKIEDLLLLLLFVNSGATLLQLKVNQTHWELGIDKDKIGAALKLRGKKLPSGNKSLAYLDNFSDAEYSSLLVIFKRFFSNNAAAYVRGYRDKIAHRMQPAVDRTQLYSRLRFPRRKGKRISIGIGGGTKVEYASETMFVKMKESLEHYISLLVELKNSVKRFDV